MQVGRGEISPFPPFQSYTVANIFTFLLDATYEDDANILKSTKYLSGNFTCNFQKAFSFTGPLPFNLMTGT